MTSTCIEEGPRLISTAYTIYAFFEWALILFDVGFDAVTALDFESFELVVRDIKGASRGCAIASKIDKTYDGTTLPARALSDKFSSCRGSQLVADTVAEKQYVLLKKTCRL